MISDKQVISRRPKMPGNQSQKGTFADIQPWTNAYICLPFYEVKLLY